MAVQPIGAERTAVSSGDVEGWWWRDSAYPNAAPPPTIPFETICGEGRAADFPRTVIDGLGREVLIETPPQRIASATLGSDEILLELIGPERLLGVTYFADDPAISNIAGQLEGIPYTDLSGSLEYLISLEADLVDPGRLQQPRRSINCSMRTCRSLCWSSSTRWTRFGQYSGCWRSDGEEVAPAEMIAEMDARLEAVRARGDEAPVRCSTMNRGIPMGRQHSR